MLYGEPELVYYFATYDELDKWHQEVYRREDMHQYPRWDNFGDVVRFRNSFFRQKPRI